MPLTETPQQHGERIAAALGIEAAHAALMASAQFWQYGEGANEAIVAYYHTAAVYARMAGKGKPRKGRRIGK